MKYQKVSVQSCCGKKGKSLILKLEKTIDKILISQLVSNSYKEYEHFTKAGILYVDNLDLIVTGPIGSDKLQVKCKTGSNCDQKLNDFEALLSNI